jgi:hypothetical protein
MPIEDDGKTIRFRRYNKFSIYDPEWTCKIHPMHAETEVWPGSSSIAREKFKDAQRILNATAREYLEHIKREAAPNYWKQLYMGNWMRSRVKARSLALNSIATTMDAALRKRKMQLKRWRPARHPLTPRHTNR